MQGRHRCISRARVRSACRIGYGSRAWVLGGSAADPFGLREGGQNTGSTLSGTTEVCGA